MPLSESRKAANAKWDAGHLKRLSLAMPVEEWERLQEATKKTGDSQNAFIRKAIKEKIQRQ